MSDKVLSELNFLLHFKSKTNLVNLRNCNSYWQYDKTDLNFSIELQEMNWNIQIDAHKVQQSDSTQTINHIQKCFRQKFQCSRRP